MQLFTLLFYDVAKPGEECLVPCWPKDSDGNDLDCQDFAVLTGVIGADDVFRSEDAPSFKPRDVMWVCEKCKEAPR